MLNKLFKRCKHDYKQVGYIPFQALDEETKKPINVYAYFYECKKCGKRFVSRECTFYYTDAAIEMMDLWEKGQYDINFKSPNMSKYMSQYEYFFDNDTESNTKSNDSYYKEALELILEEVKKFQIEMSDSENRLVISNMKNIINNALNGELL